MSTQGIEIREPEAAEGFAAEIVTPATAAEASELLVGIARWLRGTGSSQWSGLLEGQDSHGLDDAVRRGEAVLFRDMQDGPGREKGRPAGLVLLLRQPGGWDRELWGERGHEPYLYLHRLAVARAYAGSGLGRAILRWAREGAVHPGKKAIRLDCIAGNPKLEALYRSAGYASLGTSANGFCLFEQPLPAAAHRRRD
ncbi:GNAT family N-acetyltransferase [Paenibacillus albicereus]|uniref:GNAT family N-acetyltransferase n=1 Tax=Paenibacillus albicereus TaxID=2726185 RepID=A0A6H2H2T2_9BACL|nr:GNAT family N-acetyltransferase [Paenibacillus albicereus]QJC53726.1 GNAT family N-acetyltransferase [Paenibacillus albicereus]